MSKLSLAIRGLALLAAAALATVVIAAEPPTITISKSDTIALALSPILGAEGAAIAKVVRNDLALAGCFSITDANKAGTIVGGECGAGSLRGKVTDHAGGVILAHSYNGGVRETAHAFANDIVETLTGKPGIAGTKVAFVATRTGRKEIYLADCDGSNLRQLTHDGSISVAPALSTDGTLLAYTGYLKGYADIYLIHLAGGARDRIVKFPGTNSGAAFSPNGDELACTISKDGNPELYVVSTGGGGARRLTHTPGVESSPSWSPDGGEIVYSSDDGGSPQLYRIGAGGGRGQHIATGYAYCTKPVWSLDGKRIAFNIRQGGGFQVAVLELSTNAVRLVTGADDAMDPAWGPDSRHLLFTQGGNLIMLDVQNGRKVKILDGLGSISEPAWSK